MPVSVCAQGCGLVPMCEDSFLLLSASEQKCALLEHMLEGR